MLEKIKSKIVSVWRQVANYRYMMFTSGMVRGEVDLLQYEQFDDFIRDTAAACINVRRTLRSVCKFEISGADAARFERAIRNGEGFTTEQSFVGQISDNWDIFGNVLYKHELGTSSNFLNFIPTQDIVFRVARRKLTQIGIRSMEGSVTWYDPREFFYFKRSNVFNCIGRSLVAELSEYLKMKRYLSASWARHLATDGAPAGYLTFKAKTLSQDQKRDIRADFNSQYRWDRVTAGVGILEAEGEYHAFPQRQLNYGEDHRIIRDAIRESFRVPKVVLGDTDGVNFSNAFTSFLAFKMSEVDAFHTDLSNELTFWAKRHGYNCEVKISSTLDLEDFRAIAGATGRLEANPASNG